MQAITGGTSAKAAGGQFNEKRLLLKTKQPFVAGERTNSLLSLGVTPLRPMHTDMIIHNHCLNARKRADALRE